jgi:hypothetical protein
MDPMSAMPQLTAFDVVMRLIAAGIYIAIGCAALAQAPRDERTRVFCALGFAHAAAFGVQAAHWLLGGNNAGASNRTAFGIMLAAQSVAALLLFHFSQVFPRRRPWIRESGPQLPIAYVLTAPAVLLLVHWWPVTKEAITMKFGLVLVVFGFPLLVLMGLVLPVGSIVSFVRSLREQPVRTPAQMRGGDQVDGRPLPDARPTIFGVLLSQLAAGALGLIVLAPLTAAAPESFTVTIVTLTVWMLVLLTPFAFAAGVWKHRVLEIPLDPSAEVQPD